MNGRTRVALVDDNPAYRAAVARALASEADIELVGEGGSAEDALRLAERCSPDVVLLDVSMPGGGLEAALAIRECCPAVRVVMLTVSGDEEDVAAAFDAGALAYVLKGVPARELRRVVRTVAARA